MKLKFGKHKGKLFEDTPKSYQNWLLSQPWFSIPKTTPLHKRLTNWDGYSKRGEAIYNAIFEQEKLELMKQDCKDGICSCCPDSMYYGI